MKLMQTADLHLGAKFSRLGSKASKHRLNQQKAFSKIVDSCIKEKVNALIIAGDLFDKPNPPKTLITFVTKELSKLEDHKIPVFIVPGNHDFIGTHMVYNQGIFPKNVCVFGSEEFEAKEMAGTTIYGCCFNESEPDKKVLKGFKAPDDDNVRIGIVHGSFNQIDWTDQPEKAYAPIDKADIENSNLHYLALGHYHGFKELKGRTTAVYSGVPEGLSFKDNGEKFALVVEVSTDQKPVIKKIKVNCSEFVSKAIDCSTFEDDRKIRDLLEAEVGPNKLLRLTLTGSPPPSFECNAESLEEEFADKFFYLCINDETHIPMTEVADKTVKGRFIRLMQESIKKEKSEEKKKILALAYRSGLRALDGRL